MGFQGVGLGETPTPLILSTEAGSPPEPHMYDSSLEPHMYNQGVEYETSLKIKENNFFQLQITLRSTWLIFWQNGVYISILY